MGDFIIDFQITGTCNLNCNFCCGAPRDKKGYRLDEIIKVVDKLKQSGTQTIVLTGGEPLIHPDIVEIIEYIYNKGIQVYLSTNGYYLPKYIEKIYKYVSCIGLPFDGSTPKINGDMSRGEKQFETTINAIKAIKNYNKDITIKIGTVVSKVNQEDIIRIGKILFSSENDLSPDVWRLYQFTPLRFGHESKNIHEISDEKFESICKQVINSFPQKNISSLSNEESNDAYVFIEPDLKFIILSNDEYIEVGDATNMSAEDITNLKSQYIDIVARGNDNRVWLETE